MLGAPSGKLQRSMPSKQAPRDHQATAQGIIDRGSHRKACVQIKIIANFDTADQMEMTSPNKRWNSLIDQEKGGNPDQAVILQRV